jgi:glycosyltransferase involved in cell wall biosynthesis
MRILVVYHFFHPDAVISARIFSDLAAELADAGHEVSVFTCNRMIRSDVILPERESWRGIRIFRFSRPNFSQGNNFGRLFNSAILQLKWLFAFFRRRREFDAVIVGTDPQFSYLMFPFLRLMSRRVKLVHWAFDLYPEAILVNSPRWMKCLAALTRPFVPWAYRRVDVMVDIGGCMRERLLKYRHRAQCETLTPWALVEPDAPPVQESAVRRELFGDAKLGILYSGTVGYAHDLSAFIALARECRRQGINAAFCFAGYGNQYGAQTASLTPEDTNIRLAGFASEAELGKRLAAADIHLISLRRGWEGIVVPSKFFGALAIGRPVLFSGPQESCLARWISSEHIGAVMDDNIESGVRFVRELSESAERLKEFEQRAFETYGKKFSRQVVCGRWLTLLDSFPGPGQANL